MCLDALKHLAGIVSAITRGGEIVVFGSSSLLGTYPAADSEHEWIHRSDDADFILDPFDEIVGRIAHDAVGRDSELESAKGYHADIIRPIACENFPPGWRERLVPLDGCPGVMCLEPHDMAVAKLFAGRPKDIGLLADLIRAGRLDPAEVERRLISMEMTEAFIVRTHARLKESAVAGGKPLPRR